MGKITVNHFLNKDLNAIQKGNQTTYPVYVQVIVLKKNLKFKSNNIFFDYLSEDEINNSQIISLLEKEKKVVEDIIFDLLAKEKEDLITSKNINLYSERLDYMIERKFPELVFLESRKYKKFVPKAILNSSYSEINEIIFFYNESGPLSSISKEVGNCLSAIEQIIDTIEKEHFSVYDLFGGDKHDQILYDLDSYTGYDEKLTNELLLSLQNLALNI